MMNVNERLSDWPRRRQLPGYQVMAVLLLVTFIISCTAVPDSPTGQRWYATTELPGATLLPGGSVFRLEDPLPLAPELVRNELPNGLTYYIRRNGNPAGRIIMYLVVAVGSSHEEEHQRGYAHFVEHMAFNGTASFPENELVSYLRSIGMVFGAEINAYTSREQTVYTLEMPTDDPEHFATGLKVLREWATAISFDPVEVEKEKGVILEERRMGLGPHEAARRNELPVLLAGSRHADRDPIGTEESVLNATADGLLAFYKQHYRADRMAVIVVGDLDVRTAAAAVEREFSFANPDGMVRSRPVFPVAISQEMSFVATFHPDFDRSIITYSKIVPYRQETVIADYVDMLTMRITAEAIKLRLSDLNRSASMAWRDAYFDDDYFFGQTRLYTFSMTAPDGGELAAFADLAREVERLRRHGFTESEFKRTIDSWRRWLATLNVEDEDLRSRSFAEEYVRNFMYGEPVPGVVNERVYIRTILDRIRVADLDDAVRTMFGSDEGFVAVRAKGSPWGQSSAGESTAGPDGGQSRPAHLESSLTAAAFEAVLEDARSVDLAAYVAAVGEGTLFDSLPPPGAIAEERTQPNDIAELILTNGARVLLKSTSFDRDAIVFKAWAPGGYGVLPVDRQLVASLAPTLLGAAGLGSLDQTRLHELTAALQVNLAWNIGEGATVIDGLTTTRDLETFLRLVYLNATEPGLDARAFNAARNRLVEQLDPVMGNPDYRFETAWSQHLFGQSPRAAGFDPARIRTLDFDTTRSVVLETLGQASNFTYVLVGDFSIENAKVLAARYLGAIPAGTKVEPFWDLPMRIRDEAGQHLEFSIAREQRSSVRMVWAGSTPWGHERDIALRLMAQALNNRLLDALREDLGSIYVSSSQAVLTRTPVEQFMFIVSFDTDPAKTNMLMDRVRAEVASLADGSFPLMYIDQVRAAAQRNQDSRTRTNGFWAGSIIDMVANGLDFDITGRARLVSALANADIFHKLAAELLIPERHFSYVMTPERQAGP